MLEAFLLPDVSMMPTPEVFVGMATLGANYNWPVVLFGGVAVVMLVLSARKGVQAFNVELNYSNFWFVFGKRRRVRVRVHSFTSATGANCFVTTSGEFSAELVKEEDEDEDLNSSEHLGIEPCFSDKSSSSVFQTDSFGHGSFSGTKFHVGFFSELLQTGESYTLDDNVHRAGRETAAKDFPGSRESVAVLESLQKVGRRNPWPAVVNYPWDAELKLRLGAQSTGNAPPSEKKPSLISAVVRGPIHTATFSKNVVKVWDNASRRAVLSQPIQNEFITSSDVDWEEKSGLLGSLKGILSFRDIERMTGVYSVTSRLCAVNAVHSSHASPKSNDGGWMSTTVRSFLGENPELTCFWDSKACGEVASTSVTSSWRHDLSLGGFELLVRDYSDVVSVHDVRMLRRSPVTSIWKGEIEKPCVQKISSKDKWGADSADSDSEEEEDSFEDPWMRVDHEGMGDITSFASAVSPGLLSPLSERDLTCSCVN